MDRESILQELRSERDRLDSAIAALEGAAGGGAGKVRAVAKSKRKGPGGITAAGRKRLSEMMKQRWAARRKAAGGKKK